MSNYFQVLKVQVAMRIARGNGDTGKEILGATEVTGYSVEQVHTGGIWVS